MRLALTLSLFVSLSLLSTAADTTATGSAPASTDAITPDTGRAIAPATGASIDESIEQIYLRVDPTYVLPEDADPSEAPFKTIQDAVNAAIHYLERDIPVRIGLRDYLYRESVTIPGNALGALLVIVGDTRDGTIITGSEPLDDGWQLIDADKNIWSHTWTQDWGDFSLDQSWSASQGKQAPQRLVSQSRPASVWLFWEPPAVPEAPTACYRVYRQRLGTTEQHYRRVADELEATAWEDFSVEPSTAFENNQYAYYVTAVDKWGHESRPSGIVNSRARDPEGAGYAPETVRRRELFFADGKPLQMVPSLDKLFSDHEQGSFCVNDGYLRDPKDGHVLIQLPAGMTPANTSIEAATNLNLGRKDASACLYIVDKPNLVLRNLTLTGSVQDGLRLDSCRNVLLEDVRATNNGGNGIDINVQRNLQPVSEAVTLRRVTASANGACGINGSRFKNLRLEDCNTAENNWRGSWATPGEKRTAYRWDRAGLRLRNVHRGTIRGHTSTHNLCDGIWLDYDNHDILIEDSLLYQNADYAGLTLQASPGPFIVRNSQFVLNDIGLVISNAGNGILSDNLFTRNRQAQVAVLDRPERPVVDWTNQQEKIVRTENWTWRNNIFSCERPMVGQSALISVPYADWGHFYDTLTSSRNLWWAPQTERAAQLDDQIVDFSGWQMATGKDLDSLFADAKVQLIVGHGFPAVVAADSPVHDRENWPVTELPEDHREQFEATHPQLENTPR